ncbi:hypothetical protein AGABI1DRAFT_131726 [Agaricus bisporus var. burnettii JB137-S8]|uniref:Uncharacterized protein n=1 Tax=Agaricus bisporus var. burnettii (strain JB137-S8 / ATCC MYA-4627 / FGSC 10392) TaxID=597362 RepID=K5WZG0_AGABU|nr:uncharacterized protein AGABI1DRAFT_131726 [Agaricus bisporus var. burnettii JB137-S8]EKM76007.1 hypothetical protein AGABI1DRAFT_131726 [Agaricus bisporus var. burnettii JB137-S8]
MSMATSLIDHGKSFEEVRIDDYIQAYRTTAQPPKPVPELPSGDKERSSLGLPPLFKPISEHDPVLAGRPKENPLSSRIALNNGVGVGRVGTGTGTTTGTGITGSSEIGAVARRVSDPGNLPEFQDFKNVKVAGETFLTISCSEQYSTFSPEELRFYSYKNKDKLRGSESENLESITAKPDFSQHSFEELRVVYMLAGKELTSAQIIAAMQGNTHTPLS